jgi:hypothetical protein
VKTIFCRNAKNAQRSQYTPSTNPYQNETQFPLSSLKNATCGHARPPKSALCGERSLDTVGVTPRTSDADFEARVFKAGRWLQTSHDVSKPSHTFESPRARRAAPNKRRWRRAENGLGNKPPKIITTVHAKRTGTHVTPYLFITDFYDVHEMRPKTFFDTVERRLFVWPSQV